MAKKKPRTKRTRRARGTGSIFYDRGRNLWVARVPAGRLASGRTRYREVSAPTQAEVVERLRELKPPAPDTTVREWCERWYSSLSVRASTKYLYRSSLDNHILPALGHRRAADLTAHDIEDAIRSWLLRIGSNTVRKVVAHLRASLEAARRAKLIVENPARDARKPRASKTRINPFTAVELAAIIDASTSRALDCIFAPLAAVGLRLGEAIALDVTDFDREARTLSITRTFDLVHGMRPAKSENSIRTVRLPADAIPAVVLAAGGRRSGVLFASKTGHRRSHSRVRDQWRLFLSRLGIAYRSPHQLRHSVATHWIAAGVGVGDVARDLGDTVETVVKTYVHETGADTAAVMERVLERGRSASVAGRDSRAK